MMKQVLAVCGAMLLPLAACGSDDSTDGSQDATTATDASPSDGDTDATVAEPAAEATMPPSEDDGGDSGGSGPSTATATIDGETYEFSTEGAVVAQCQTDMFGIFSVQLPGDDGGINIIALLEGTDPAVVEQVNAVQVSVGDDDWIADESSDMFDTSDALQPGMSQVDSVEIDGSTVSGTATFVRRLSVFGGGEPEVVTGTFEATCGEERIS
jgi:hypothetical protein